ncbi:MAG: AsmA-like C-terminal region-containing protein [Candidatus Omnitrophota bacterium]
MKRIIAASLIIIILLVAGVTLFIATFNIDSYRAALAKAIGKAIGARVEIGKLSLVWKDGISIKAEDFVIYSAVGKQEKAGARAKSGSFSVELMPLLKKEFRFGVVALSKPHIEIQRNPDGAIVIAGMKPQIDAAAKKAGGSEAAIPLFFVKTIELKDGEVIFTDMSKTPLSVVSVRHIDVRVNGVSLGASAPFSAAMALFARRQNVEIRGSVNFSQAGSPIDMINGNVKIDMGAIDIYEVVKAFPEAKNAGFRENPKGIIGLDVKKFSFTSPLKRSDLTFQYKNGRIAVSHLPDALNNITVKGALKNDTLKVDSFSAGFADGAISGSSNVSDLSGAKRSALKLSLKDLALAKMLPQPTQGQPFLSGHVNLVFEGGSRGFTAEELQDSLTGRGSLSVNDGVIVNMNVVRDVFRQISMIPGLVELFEDRMSDAYNAKIRSKDTVLYPIEVPFICEGRFLKFPKLSLKTDHFNIFGVGEAGFDRSIGANVILQINSDLSNAFMRSINDLQYLMNRSGQLEIPIKVKGYLPEVNIIPDLQYVAKKYAAAKAREVVTEALGKMMKK